MSGKRVRIVAVQVVIVGALLLVVYLTLLRPEDQKPLFGVGVPVGPGQVAQVPGGEPGGPGGDGGNGGGARGERGLRGEAQGGHGGASGHRPHGGGPGGASSAVSGAAAGAAPSGPATPTRDGAEPGVTPSEQQYGDTVSQLFGNL